METFTYFPKIFLSGEGSWKHSGRQVENEFLDTVEDYFLTKFINRFTFEEYEPPLVR